MPYRWRDGKDVGDWKATREEAREDAIQVGAAERQTFEPFQFVWTSPFGWMEESP